tara:strand:+ start:961 stop:1770 length:810 start_codon:yes stop_codon:yes gene_type:complete
MWALEGFKDMRKILKLFAFFYCGYSAAATLSYEQLSTDTFQLILKNDVPLEIDQAQSSIYSGAVQTCNGKKPLFGKYSFYSTEPISKDAETSSFTFLQEIRCTNEVAVTAAPKKLDLSNIQEKAIKSAAKKLTEEFLSAREAGEFKKAYDMLGSGMKEINEFSAWKSKEFDYVGENLGKLVSRDIWRVTLYNNPPNSSIPGLYVAADYENSYEKSPIHCGYVMWHLPAANSGEFTVMREEYGNITSDILKKIPEENLQNVRKQIGCRAF